MKRIAIGWSCLVAAMLAIGCGADAGPESGAGPAAEAKVKRGGAKEHDHDHAHDHGPDHKHGPGPHGGTVFNWGGGAYHLEFTVDHEKKQAVVYILGDDEKTPAPIKADSIQLALNDPMADVELAASPLDGETDGKSSRFVGEHDALATVKSFAGTVSGLIEGTPYTGDFQEEAHSD